MDIFMYAVIAVVAAIAWYAYQRNAWYAIAAGAVGIVLSTALYYGGMYAQASDYELLSGSVIEKTRTYDPETETYTCGTDSKGNSQTCTRLIPRWLWSVVSDVYEDVYSEHTYAKYNEPEIYKFTSVGDPYTTTKRFVNFQYVSEQTISLNHDQQYTGWLPDYPQIYDGFKVTRGFSQIVLGDELSHSLAVAQRDWGKFYGANVIVCIVDVKQAGFSEALKNKWYGGKKNDVVLTLYVQGTTVQKAEVFSRSTSEKRDATMADFNMILRENAARMGEYDIGSLLGVLAVALPYFQREDLSKYDFLESDYQSPWWLGILIIIIMLGAMFGTVKFLENQFRYRSRRYYR